jgi:hypothetical protein
MTEEELEEIVMRAIAQADERNGGPPYDYRMTMGKHAVEQLRDEAREVLADLRKVGALAPRLAP